MGVVGAFGQSRPVEQECTTGEMKPIFRVPNAKVVSAKPRDLEESVKLKGGKHVSVKQGGCAHYGIQVSFVEKVKADTVAAALKVLCELKTQTESPEAFDQMIKLIEKYGAETQLGEAMQDKQFEMTTVYLDRKMEKGQQQITVTFSFAL